MAVQTIEPSGLALFLSQRLWERSTGDKFVYDIEHVHYGLLSLLLERSPLFAAKFLASSSRVVRVMQVEVFDLEVRVVPDAVYLVEVKTWHRLTPRQLDTQAKLLERRSAQGIYLLTPFQICQWTPEEIRRRSDGRGRVLPFQDVATMLREITASLSGSLREVAESYADAIRLLLKRTQEAV